VQADGTLTWFGLNDGQCDVPDWLGPVVAVASAITNALANPCELARVRQSTSAESHSNRIECPDSEASIEPQMAVIMKSKDEFDNADDELQEAVRQSEDEDLHREMRDVHEAVLRSKADPWSADGVVLLRITFHTPDVISHLLHSPSLADCCSRVNIAGCEVRPAWASGALLLVPVTEEQIREAGIHLKAHNILMLTSDVKLVAKELSLLPRRKRPQLKPEHQAEGDVLIDPTMSSDKKCSGNIELSACAAGSDEHVQVGSWMCDLGLVVENTFLTFSFTKDIACASSVVWSAPAAGASSSEQTNPRQWRLPQETE
jgi:hypothetical protein